jgi:hypothetical protein
MRLQADQMRKAAITIQDQTIAQRIQAAQMREETVQMRERARAMHRRIASTMD